MIGRPEIPIDWDRADELLMAGCVGTEVAAHFGMHPETFYDRVVKKYNIAFSQYAAQKRACGDAIIREAQFKKAIKKLDNSMLIWLGKQRLGQKENNIETQVTAEVDKKFLDVMNQLASMQSTKKEGEIIPPTEI